MNASGVDKACKSNAQHLFIYFHQKIMFYLYILKSINKNKIYIGFTENLKKRFSEHNNGESSSTKNFRPWKLVYYEAYVLKSDATKRENALKKYGKALAQLKKRISFDIL
jgi:putative endonuclease